MIIPKKVKFFIGQTIHHVSTLDQLLRKFPSLIGSFLFILCLLYKGHDLNKGLRGHGLPRI